MAEGAHILHSLPGGVADDPVALFDLDPVQGEQRCLNGGSGGGVEFDGATGLGPVADHPGQIFEDVFDRPFHMVDVAADQIGDPGGGAGTGGHRTAADR